MDSPDETLHFQFQCGLDRGYVTVDTAGLTLKTLKEHAFDFLLSKVSRARLVIYRPAPHARYVTPPRRPGCRRIVCRYP